MSLFKQKYNREIDQQPTSRAERIC